MNQNSLYKRELFTSLWLWLFLFTFLAENIQFKTERNNISSIYFIAKMQRRITCCSRDSFGGGRRSAVGDRIIKVAKSIDIYTSSKNVQNAIYAGGFKTQKSSIFNLTVTFFSTIIHFCDCNFFRRLSMAPTGLPKNGHFFGHLYFWWYLYFIADPHDKSKLKIKS